MDILIAILLLIVGLIGIFRPDFFYKSELLTPEQIARNKRIWNRCGAGMAIVGFVLLAMQLFFKRP